VPGGADESYGIEVAKLAGVPNEVIKRAREVLNGIESESKREVAVKQRDDNNNNITLADCMNDVVCEKLKDTNIDTLTPIEALNLVYQLKKMLI
jgi:DNA mismatch repair protein MutS